MEKIIGVFKLAVPLYVRIEALDENYNAKIGQHNVTLHFPKLPNEPMDYTAFDRELLPPSNCVIKCDESWGQLRQYSTENFKPKSCCVLQVYMECSTEEPDSVSADIYSSIDEWRTLLNKVVCLEEKHFIGYFNPFQQERSSIDLYKNNPSFERYDPDIIYHLSITLLNDDMYVTRDNLCRYLGAIECGKKLKLEYELLVQAYEERSKENYRYSLVQALSAFEVCIGSKISDICDQKGIDSDRLMGKKSLGDKLEMLRALGIGWVTPDPNGEITKHRNDLFHSRLLSPTIELLNNVINKIEIYLQAYSPNYYE